MFQSWKNYLLLLVSTAFLGLGMPGILHITWLLIVALIFFVLCLVNFFIYIMIETRGRPRLTEQRTKLRFTVKVPIQGSKIVPFKSGIGKDDFYFFFVVDFQPLVLKGSDMNIVVINKDQVIYYNDVYCVVSDNLSCTLYRKPTAFESK